MQFLQNYRRLALASLATLALFALPAHATILTPTYEAQLESWLGQGNLDFTNVFTKTTGNTAADFHAAVDGKGATFTLAKISGYWDRITGTPIQGTQIIGGYNPQSWDASLNSYRFSLTDAERTGFIYNLTSSVLQRQNLIGQGAINSGAYQTDNEPIYGPTFGGGWDILISGDLKDGIAANLSYGGTSWADEIVSGPTNYNNGSNNNGGNLNYYAFGVDELEVYTVALAQNSNQVPDSTSTLGLLGIAMVGLAVVRRRIG